MELDASRRKASNTTAPIHKLPVEIFVWVLKLSLACDRSEMYIRIGQLKRVCVIWADRINSCPSFWNVLTNRLGLGLVSEVMRRSGAVPLLVDVAQIPYQDIQTYIAAVRSASHRWHALAIHRFVTDDILLHNILQVPAPQLQRLAITGWGTDLPTTIPLFGGQAPFLRSVEITSNEWSAVRPFISQLKHLVVRCDDFPPPGFDLDAVIQALAASPDIESVEFLNPWQQFGQRMEGLAISPNPVVLSRIQNFTLNRVFGRGALALLEAVRLPLNCAINVSMNVYSDWGPLDPALGMLYQRFTPAVLLGIDIRIAPSRFVVVLNYEWNGGVSIEMENHRLFEGGSMWAFLEYILSQLGQAIRSSGVSVHLRIGQQEVASISAAGFTASMYKSILETADRFLPSTIKASIYGLHYDKFISYAKLGGFPKLSELIIEENRIVAPWKQVVELAESRSSLAADPRAQILALDSVSLLSRGLDTAARQKLSEAVRQLNWTDDPNAHWAEALPETFYYGRKLKRRTKRAVHDVPVP
ncbi:hypothetical protein FS837_010339 [Tulasnella sp. UAMH 9824]|nr:hypothetical protein FS837_010339 [Tulasnella sp. UAMH 9824]